MFNKSKQKKQLYNFAKSRGYALPKLKEMVLQDDTGVVRLMSENVLITPFGTKAISISTYDGVREGHPRERTAAIYSLNGDVISFRRNGKQVDNFYGGLRHK